MKLPETMLVYTNPWKREETMQVAFALDRYANGNGLYVGMCAIGEEGYLETWCDVTVNIPGWKILKENEAFVDMPNIYDSQFLDWMRENDLISDFSGEYGYSGFCQYPLVQFNLENLQKHAIKMEE